MRDKNIGKHIVPIVPDESRTFGMEGMFRQLGIWNQQGQLYTPQDADQLMFYKEDKNGQILQEGINEAGGMCDWIAAATSYSTHGVPMIPFYIFYSMFGFQRVGDLRLGGRRHALARLPARRHRRAHDAERRGPAARGRPLAPHRRRRSRTASRTTRPSRYEVAVIIQDGLRRMYAEQEDVYYYLTVMNENYAHPAMPEGAEPGILKGMYLLPRRRGRAGKAPRVQLLGSGTILREVIAAADLLQERLGRRRRPLELPVASPSSRATAWRSTRWNMLHPDGAAAALARRGVPRGHAGPGDRRDRLHARCSPSRSARCVPRRYVVLGTDGFGRSDTREKLRRFFEVDRTTSTVAALKALADDGAIPAAKVAEAIAKYGIDPDKPAPWTV